jgi:hypothetical protein
LSYKFIEFPFPALKEKYAVVKSGDEVKNVSENSIEKPARQFIQEEVIAINMQEE